MTSCPRDNNVWVLGNFPCDIDVYKRQIPNLSAGQAIITGVSFDLPVIVKITPLPQEEAPNSSNSELLKIWQVR